MVRVCVRGASGPSWVLPSIQGALTSCTVLLSVSQSLELAPQDLNRASGNNDSKNEACFTELWLK